MYRTKAVQIVIHLHVIQTIVMVTTVMLINVIIWIERDDFADK